MLTVNEITAEWIERAADRRKSKIAAKAWSDPDRRLYVRRERDAINQELYALVDSSGFSDELKAAQKAAIRSVGL